MGLFDFAKDIGNKLFNADAEAAEKITAHIEANNPGIQNLGIIYNEGKVTIIGHAKDAEAAQKVILMVGNIKGVSEVIPKLEIVDTQEAATDTAGALESTDIAGVLEPTNVEYYTIKSGDTLSKIAQHYYQNASEYPRIFEANREVIKDPNLIFVGQKIRIPLA